MDIKRTGIMLIVFWSLTINISAQNSSLYIPINIQHAYDYKTRSLDGFPGPKYWQNRADYTIAIRFDPKTCLLSGDEKIIYFNNSGASLNELIVHLLSNLFKKGNSRDFNIDYNTENDGVTIDKLVIDGKSTDLSLRSKTIDYDHSSMTINLDRPLLPKNQLELQISWHYTVNNKSHMRTGAVDSTSYFIAYSYPRIAVYDDIDGWNNFKYTGFPEFYNDFGNYDVSITVPQNFIIWATGSLQNSKDVLSEKYAQRYQSAFTSDSVLHIINLSDLIDKNFTPGKENTWKFKAENVSDFAFATSNHYLWDATSLIVDKKSGRRVMIDAAYNLNSEDFYGVASIARQAVKYMSFNLPGVPFPYPKMTVFNGLDEMEYPMMVNNLSNTVYYETVKLTTHEILHTYLPFYTGCNETKYAWMDEGFTTFCDYIISSTIDTVDAGHLYGIYGYKDKIGYDIDMPVFSSSKYLREPVYWWNSYYKPANFFFILKDYLGDEKFKTALHLFMDQWNGKHPMPYDLFFTFMFSTGENLDWLIKPWFFEYGYVDLGIKQVTQKDGFCLITLEKKGNYPAPVNLKLYYSDGTEKVFHKSASLWKNGETENLLAIPAKIAVKKIEMLDLHEIDANPKNNFYICK